MPTQEYSTNQFKIAGSFTRIISKISFYRSVRSKFSEAKLNISKLNIIWKTLGFYQEWLA